MHPAPFIAPPCREAVRILHADEELLFVDKPAGLLSVPGRHPANQDSLIHRLTQDYPGARIVHRLDMATSGVMVLALNAESHRALSRQFEQRRVDKQYEAEVFGRPAPPEGRIDLPLSCDWPNRPRQQVDREYGKSAVTLYRLMNHSDKANCSRLLLMPETGRSHQLRVHLAAIGHPILGCEFYAHPQARQLSSRLLLHATRLRLQHPVTGESLAIDCPAPF